MSDVVTYLPATSAMWDFNPNNMVGGWMTDKSGRRVCPGGYSCAAEIPNVQLNQIGFFWEGSPGAVVSLGVDGQMSTGDSGAGSAMVPTTQGLHTARIQVDCTAAEKGKDFALVAATLKTTTTFSAPPQNSTLDDSSSSIIYSGWTSTTPAAAPVEAIRTGKFYHDTISYTSSGGASAAFTFSGQMIYVYGCTGPSFGTFEVVLDGSSCGLHNATNAVNTFGTLLFVGQSGDGEHNVEIRNMVDGSLLALDWFVATGAASGGGEWVGGGQPGHAPGVPPSGPAPAPGTPAPTPSAVFPGAQAGSEAEGGTSNSAIIGGILGALFGLLLLFFLFRYRQYRKEGGEGGFFATLCGPSRKPPQTVGTKSNEFKLWPMVRFKPKYAT